MIALGGVCGFWASFAQFKIYKKEGEDPNIIYVFLILTAALVAVGLRGIIFTRREIEADSDIRRLSLRSPQENILGGIALLTIGVVLTVSSDIWPELFGGYYVVFYGLMIVGAVQALVGASRRAMTKR